MPGGDIKKEHIFAKSKSIILTILQPSTKKEKEPIHVNFFLKSNTCEFQLITL